MSPLKKLVAIQLLGAVILASECGLANVDWELMLSIAMGVTTIGVMWLEHKRETKFAALADDHEGRLTELKLLWAYAAEKSDLDALGVELQNAIDKLALRIEPPDITQLAERTAAIAEIVGDMRERIATLEARADHKPWTLTRRKDGKFASVTDTPPEDPK